MDTEAPIIKHLPKCLTAQTVFLPTVSILDTVDSTMIVTNTFLCSKSGLPKPFLQRSGEADKVYGHSYCECTR